MPDSNQVYLRIENLTKHFGAFVAVSDLSLEINSGEFICFLGPSGCGKTTLLRAIAGLDPQTVGRINQAGKDISDLPVSERDFGIVFQSYALFPNLTVYQNVAYGLENQRLPRQEIHKRVTDLLELVGLPEQIEKYPAQLSGGQQQRVALSRALATSPGLLLLDEPLSALDARVRSALRLEIRTLHQNLGITTILVTHDQEEALSVCDVVSVLENGKVIQSATPQEIYLNPVSQTVANSVGDPNILKGFSTNGRVETSLGSFVSAYNGALDVSIRPECIELTLDTEGSYVVTECTFYGHDQVISFSNNKGEIFRARSLPNTIYESGDKVTVNISEVTTFPSKV